MVVRTIEILLEYFSIMYCLYKIPKEKIRINVGMILVFVIEWMLMVFFQDEIVLWVKKFLVYGSILLYSRIFISKSWKKTTKIVGLMTVIISTLQLIFLFIVTLCFGKEKYLGMIVNALVFLSCILWKEKYSKIIANTLKKINGLVLMAVMYFLVLLKALYLCDVRGTINVNDSIQLWFEILVLSVLFIFLLNEENKTRQKTKELQMYQLYNQAFEETISTIRIRQHEFENHINAIKCMRYSIKNKEKLLSAQEQYCNDVLQESKIENLLKLKLEPALIGFLYAKLTTAEEKGILVEYKIDPIEIAGRIKPYEMIELVGVLFDNAIEALGHNGNKRIIMKLLNNENGFLLEIANLSRIYTNTEIEQFCVCGYSTKKNGNQHGIGLARVKEITNKVNATLLIKNQTYQNENYLCFRIYFE